MIPPVERRICDTPDPVGDVPIFRSRRKADGLQKLRPAPRSNGFDLFWLGVIACGVGAGIAALIWGVLR